MRFTRVEDEAWLRKCIDELLKRERLRKEDWQRDNKKFGERLAAMQQERDDAQTEVARLQAVVVEMEASRKQSSVHEMTELRRRLDSIEQKVYAEAQIPPTRDAVVCISQ